MLETRTEPMLSQNESALLYEVAASLHAIRDLDDMLNQILTPIQRVFQVEGVSIALHDADKQEFYFIRTIEDIKFGQNHTPEKICFPDHVGIAGWVLQNDKAALIPDVADDERFYSELDKQEEFKTRSMICVPLRTRKGLIGVLYALNKIEGTFTNSEGRLLEVLSSTIAIAIENARLYGEIKQRATNLEKENRRLFLEVQQRFNFKGIIGSSVAMRRVFVLIEKVLDVPTSVLLQGETGTGKELIARVIHYSGPRKNKPFVAENCGALSETLLESELFGHVKGAFTGAVIDKKGLFELAHGGTIFLDEISETTPALQTKLLRVLQEKQVRRVGGSHAINIDVRVIASSNLNLEAEVKKSDFREDLFYRICVFPVFLPPLREHKEDIPLLAAHFLKKFRKKITQAPTRIAPAVIQLLTLFNWPGNVREFENEIERAMIMAVNCNEIAAEHLSEKITASADKISEIFHLQGTLKEVVEKIERQMVGDALKKTNNNRTKAADLLGLTRQGLINKIQRYQLA